MTNKDSGEAGKAVLREAIAQHEIPLLVLFGKDVQYALCCTHVILEGPLPLIGDHKLEGHCLVSFSHLGMP